MLRKGGPGYLRVSQVLLRSDGFVAVNDPVESKLRGRVEGGVSFKERGGE